MKIRGCKYGVRVLYYSSVNRAPRMLSSAGEHRPYKAGVVGSKPTASTNQKWALRLTYKNWTWVNSEVAKRG